MTSRTQVLILAFFILLPLSAQEVSFRHLSVEDGLSQNTINCIYQDVYGFLWFGTQDGLNCYDGYNFTVYRRNAEDSASLSHNWIWDIIEDDSFNLWIATWNGLTQYDRNSRTFRRFFPDSTTQNAISGTRPASMVKDVHGNIWIATWGGGLNLLNPAELSFTQYRDTQTPGQNYPGDFIRKLYLDSKGTLWIGSWNGLWKCEFKDRGNPEFESFMHQPDDPGSLSSMRITTLKEDPEGRMWIGTLGGGLNLFNPATKKFKRYLHDPATKNSLSSNELTSLEIADDGTLWVGTVNSGLNVFNNETEDFIRYRRDPAIPTSLASDNVYSLLTDRGGVMWVGAGGLNIFNPDLLRFGCSGPLGLLKEQLAGMSVYAVMEDSRGCLWVGTHHNGLAFIDTESSKLSWYRKDPANSNSIGSDNISGLEEDGHGNIWVASAGDGLSKLDLVSGHWTRYRDNSGNPETAGMDHINGLVVDDKEVVWMATRDNGIVCFDPVENQFRSYRTHADDPTSLSGDYLLRIFKDSQGDIWIGTWGAGLCRTEGEGRGFTRFMNDPGDKTSLPDNIVHSLYEQQLDTGRLIWIGTANGLASLDPDHPERGFTPSAANPQLPSLSVYGTLFDDRGQQWISTNSGISVYVAHDSTLKHYTHRDGLPGNEFNAGASLELAKGLFAFGGIEGLLVFNPDSVGESSYEPEVALTMFSVLNEPVYSAIDLNALERITLSHKQNFFSFEFASMDFSDPENNYFMYSLDGIDEDWNISGNRNFASYTKIDPGQYVFRVRGSNSDGKWSAKETVIGISITPPFWKRWWFRGTLLACGILAFYGIHLYRIRRVREIERLRVRIASDLHDDIGSALTRISVHSQQIMTQEEIPRIRQSTTKINQLSREMVSTMSDIVWSIDARNDTLSDFLSRMQDLTHTLLSDQDVQVSFRHQGMDINRSMKVQVRQNLYYIFKEAIHNIARHAGASKVEISVENVPTEFRMKITDNGLGYDPESIKGGNGIRNMHMRAARIGAVLEIVCDNGVMIGLKMKAI